MIPFVIAAVAIWIVVMLLPPAMKAEIRDASRDYTVDLGDGVKLEMVWIPAGRYLMGADTGPLNSRPTRLKKVDGFWMGKYEVTNRQYRLFKADHVSPTGYGADDLPVSLVTHWDAEKYCQWLSELTGDDYRLPKETQWEWACRAGSVTAYYWGPDWREAYANASGAPSPVGGLKPNAWGLYDMLGNVGEICDTWYTASYATTQPSSTMGLIVEYNRVYRGGSWSSDPENLTSRYRRYLEDKAPNVGFRVIRMPEESSGEGAREGD